MTITMTRPPGVGRKIAHDPGDPLVTSHCFAGETRYWTKDGLKTLGETVDTVQEVLTNGGKGAAGTWREAMIHSYGEQPLWKVTLRRNKRTTVIRATAEHRWIVRDHGTNKPAKNRVVVTSDLKPDHRLAWQLPKTRIWDSIPSPFGIAHGVTFGDGSKTTWGSTVQLWGEKDAQLLEHFPATIRTQPVKTPGGVDGIRVNDLPLFFKDRPSLGESVPYLYGWLAGYFAADGSVSAQGQAVLCSASRENIEFAQLVGALLGIGTYDVQEKQRQGYGDEPSALYSIQFIGSTLRPAFFLIREHRERYEAIIERGNAERIGWTVVSVEETGEVEEVFCARVPETENFVLDGWINVMNCPFCGSGQVVGRSDGTIGCDFCGQAYIVRVQPAFPGMPQMPNGPGAPSDVGPDGMVDPGMIGPDGMPMDGGPPPGDETGGGPPGASGDDDGGGAPGGGDGKEDDSGSGPPPKGKPKKKSSRVYRGVHGQPLTEEQLIRHVAVVASGRDPRVLAVLRRTAVDPSDPGSWAGSREAWGGAIGHLAGHRMEIRGGQHHVLIGQHHDTGHWFATIHPKAPEHQDQAHMISLGRGGENLRDRTENAINHPAARAFIDATQPGSSRTASRRAVAAFPDGLTHYRTLSSGHQVSLGRHGEDWVGIINAPHPHERHSHMMFLGRGDDPREAADRALSRGPARDFVHSTTDWSGAAPGNPVETKGAPPGRWWDATPQRSFQDPIFHSASAR